MSWTHLWSTAGSIWKNFLVFIANDGGKRWEKDEGEKACIGLGLNHSPTF